MRRKYTFPLMMEEQRSNIVLQSVDRASGSTGSHDFRIGLPETLEGCYGVSLIQIPHTFYTIRSGHNTIYFYENSTSKTATVTPGYYSSSTIAAAVKSALDTASGGHNTYTITYSSSTKKLSASASNAFYFEWSADTGNGCWRQLGFTQGTDTTSGTSVTFPNVIDLVGAHFITVEIRQAQSYTLSTGTSSSNWGIVVPIDVDYGSYLLQKTTDIAQRIQFSSRTKHLNIRVLDEEGASLDLNGSNWTVVLSPL